jgi:uncharacterized protein DUF2695
MDERPEPRLHELRTLPDAIAAPMPVECLACYVWRMLDEFGCNATLRWARRWRDARAPRATALERRVAARGGFCDCELFLNVWVPKAESPTNTACSDGSAPYRLCRGVRRDSSQPCDLWADGRI